MSPRGWTLAFILTIAVETPVYWLALRRPFGWARALLLGLLSNLMTHPIAWAAITGARHPFPGVFLAVEAGVWVAEALLVLLLSRTSWSKRSVGATEALAISFAANGLSAGLGLLF